MNPIKNTISVQCITPEGIETGAYSVEIVRGEEKIEYTVGLNEDYYQMLCGGEISHEDLIKKSFEFLLEQESASAILREFDLPVIEEYFPEYKNEIRKR